MSRSGSGRSERLESDLGSSGCSVWGLIYHVFGVDFPLVKPMDGLSFVGFQSLNSTLTQQLVYLRWQIDWAIISLK